MRQTSSLPPTVLLHFQYAVTEEHAGVDIAPPISNRGQVQLVITSSGTWKRSTKNLRNDQVRGLVPGKDFNNALL
jgi:hypothetical protein